MNYVAYFFAGAFLCNCIPHLAAGLRGEAFPSPFAKPPGKGDSSPLVNVLWGAFNLVAGILLLHYFPIAIGAELSFALFLVGGLAIGIHLALHFGKVRKDRSAK